MSPSALHQAAPYLLITLALALVSCNQRQQCDPGARALANEGIAVWNDSIGHNQIQIHRWRGFDGLTMNDSANALFLIMAHYCEGVNEAFRQFAEHEERESRAANSARIEMLWIANDDYDDLPKLKAAIAAFGFTGPCLLLENEHYGCYTDQRERNRVFLEEAFPAWADSVVYQSGLIAVLWSPRSGVLSASNSVAACLSKL